MGGVKAGSFGSCVTGGLVHAGQGLYHRVYLLALLAFYFKTGSC